MYFYNKTKFISITKENKDLSGNCNYFTVNKAYRAYYIMFDRKQQIYILSKIYYLSG